MKQHRIAAAVLVSVLVPLASAGVAGAAEETQLSCPFSGEALDFVSRGFYVTGYAGHTLGRVRLGYSASVAGLYRIGLTARRGTFDGPQIGATEWVTINVPTSGEAFAVFDFGGAPVTPGNTITFTHTFEGPGSLFYDTGNGPCANVTQTHGTNPPLDSFRRDSVGVIITSFEPNLSGCVANDTTLCIDDDPGDQRFRVRVTYNTSQAGGFSGSADAIPLAPLGVFRGGLFWFFTQDNPEMLVKVLNGCSVNNRFWVFLTAGTNVGFTVTVRDMQTGATRTYSNPDLRPAPPVQDTSAFLCN
jgi:hypothetical protein